MSEKRPVILTFADHYLPGFKAGGPIRTLSHLIDRLSDEFDFRVVTRDRDLGDRATFAGVKPNIWTKVGNADVLYRTPDFQGLRCASDTIQAGDYDLLYLNSFFSTHFSITPMLLRFLHRKSEKKVLLAPRGEFSLGALSMKSMKKSLYIKVIGQIGLYRGVTFEATSEHELADIRKSLGGVPHAVAANLSGRSSGSDLKIQGRTSQEPLRVIFLSRISPMKNLSGAIEILKRCATEICIDIYGAISDSDYWNRCQNEISTLPSNVRATYKGSLFPTEVDDVLSNYDLFLLPTLGENYGHVIREALSAGVPVLISDRTPWRDLSARKVGADLSLDDPQAFSRWIDDFSRLDPEARHDMRQAARRMGDDPEVAARDEAANRTMLRIAMGCEGVGATPRDSTLAVVDQQSNNTANTSTEGARQEAVINPWHSA